MIRFRLGQTWKRERAARPRDAVALDVDGVNLLTGANEEPLEQVVPDVVEGVLALSRGEQFVQVSLPEAHLELVLRRVLTEVEVAVVSLGRPSRWVRAPVRLELEELVSASARVGRALLEDLGDEPPSGSSVRLKQMLRQCQAL